MSASKILILVAVICFVAAALGIGVAGISIGWLGLAFYAAASLV